MKKDKNNYTEEYVRKHRTFPVGNTVLLVLLVAVQVCLVIFAVRYSPQPQDIIRDYTVTVEPREDGSLDIEYRFHWEAVDTSEELTWVEIGMANPNYTVYPSSVSPNVSSHPPISEDGYVALRLDFNSVYKGGDTLGFGFKVNQKQMLCQSGDGYLYEFVPGWFNSTPVENYEFRWKASEDTVSAAGAELRDGYYVWSGSFGCGEFTQMAVRYSSDAFAGQATVERTPFDSSGAYNELEEEKGVVCMMVCLVVIVLLIFEVYIVDSYVSYNRGRGFLSGYGHRVHTYGRLNPHYRRAHAHHTSQNSRGGFGGGCACACACACAGGGRAGCSQKDTYSNVLDGESN